MSSLAKEILDNKRGARSDCDEFGIPLKNRIGRSILKNPNYYVARAFFIEKQDPDYDPDTVNRLHLRGDSIYQHHDLVKEDPHNFYRLTRVGDNIPLAIQVSFWEELKKCLPVLNTNVYKISDGLWWDKRQGELVMCDSEDIKKRVKEEL